MTEGTQAVVEQAVTQETPAEQTPVTPPADARRDSVSAAMLAAAKERKNSLNLKKTLHTTTQELADLKVKFAALESSAPKKASNPIESLQRDGYSYQDAVEFIMNNNSLSPEQKLVAIEKKFDERLKQVEDKEKTAEEKRVEELKKAQESELESFRISIEDHLTENAESYELSNIRFKEAKQYIEDVISTDIKQKTELYNEDPDGFREKYGARVPKLLSIKDAADLVEKYYEEDELEKIMNSKKVQARLKPKEPEKEEPKPSGSKTLSNLAATSSVSSGLPARTEADRIARALAKLEGK